MQPAGVGDLPEPVGHVRQKQRGGTRDFSAIRRRHRNLGFARQQFVATDHHCQYYVVFLDFDQELATLLPACGRMKNLRKLDIGGNNFQMLRRHNKQGNTITAILMELVKVISDEETVGNRCFLCTIDWYFFELQELREIVLSDCKLGGHLSVLLNALGVASTLRSLDISGNEIGNFGARLMAKALQINSSLETLYIDRNQIGSDGFWDLANALKEFVPSERYDYLLRFIAEMSL